ncbi:MAG: ABC transporter ATP-binding protein [Bacilli bacterium]|nr:ABC transporter ATP-binding protein [Bacilli bacterium]
MGYFVGVRLKEFAKINKRYHEIAYPYLEDPQFVDKAKVAFTALDSNNIGFENIYHGFFRFLPTIFSVILYCIIIGLFQPLIFVACIFGTIITVIVNKQIAKYVDKRKEDRARAFRQKQYFYDVCYDFSYGKDIRMFNLKDKLIGDYRRKANDYINVIKDIANKKFAIGLLELLMLLIQDGVAYFFIIYGYFNNMITLGEVALYVGAVIGLSSTLRRLTEILSTLQVDANYCKSYYLFMDDTSYFASYGNRKALPKTETLEIEFRNVSFKYPNTDKWILQNFNFKINKGERLAIVGTNGAGKSTLVKLITGLFDVDEGEILVNGFNIKEFDRNEYWKMFSVVYQDVFIYAGSVLENVIGTDNTLEDKERGITCINLVNLSNKIKSLPKGYDQQLLKIIDETGIELSGGENQKLVIARSLYKDANMVILDEPTASLDPLAEAEIYESFDNLVKDKTAIYISHRLASTKFCDKIALFTEQGLSEYGTHEELMALKGKYYEMFMTQSKYYQVEENTYE